MLKQFLKRVVFFFGKGILLLVWWLFLQRKVKLGKKAGFIVYGLLQNRGLVKKLLKQLPRVRQFRRFSAR